jgi:hypothetical protein
MRKMVFGKSCDKQQGSQNKNLLNMPAKGISAIILPEVVR